MSYFQLLESTKDLKNDEEPTFNRPQSLVVANGGLGNGVSREELCEVLKEMGEVESLLMPPHKPYALVSYRYSSIWILFHFILTRPFKMGEESKNEAKWSLAFILFCFMLVKHGRLK